MEPAQLPNNTTFLLSKPWKFQFISCSGSKVIPFLPSDRQTDTQTHILHPYMHGQDFFLYGNLYLSLHYIPSFALLTHFVCEGLKSTFFNIEPLFWHWVIFSTNIFWKIYVANFGQKYKVSPIWEENVNFLFCSYQKQQQTHFQKVSNFAFYWEQKKVSL